MLVSYCPASPLHPRSIPWQAASPIARELQAVQHRTWPPVQWHSDYIDRASNNHAPATPPPRRPPGHVLRHRNINVCSPAGLLPARTEPNRTTETNSHREAPAPTTSKSRTARRPPGPAESAKTLLLPAPFFTYRRGINEAGLAPDEEPGRGRASLVSTKTTDRLGPRPEVAAREPCETGARHRAQAQSSKAFTGHGGTKVGAGDV